MITNAGKTQIKRYLAGFSPSIAQSIAFGLGSKAESVGDTRLDFEVDRANITLTSFDFVANRLVFKAPVPEQFEGKIYEVALYSMSADAAAGEFGSRLITSFDSITEEWVDATSGAASAFDSTNTRIGLDSLRQAPLASGTTTDTLRDVLVNLGGYSAADKFVIAMNVGNANTASVRARFLTDTSNYYEINFGTPTAGYKVVEISKGNAVATGTPNWETITELRILTTATAAGAAQVDFDGLRVVDTDTANEDYIMVSRELLATPFVKQAGMAQEIEFTMEVNI